jgi:tyrosine-protein phosphatase YwqE
MSKEVSDHVQMIDVLWIEKGGECNIAYGFDVEYTTGITEAITRGSYIPTIETRRFLVIPEEREKTLYKKIEAPLFKDRIEGYQWHFIFFKDLKEFYEFTKHKREIPIEQFEKISKTLIPEREKQESLLRYR